MNWFIFIAGIIATIVGLPIVYLRVEVRCILAVPKRERSNADSIRVVTYRILQGILAISLMGVLVTIVHDIAPAIQQKTAP